MLCTLHFLVSGGKEKVVFVLSRHSKGILGNILELRHLSRSSLYPQWGTLRLTSWQIMLTVVFIYTAETISIIIICVQVELRSEATLELQLKWNSQGRQGFMGMSIQYCLMLQRNIWINLAIKINMTALISFWWSENISIITSILISRLDI